MARAMVLSAGLGTRLRPLTEELPKALLPLGDRSFLEHAFTALRDARLGREVVVNVHHLTAEFERQREHFSLEAQLIHEPEIRGTAGGIAGARSLLGPAPVVVLVADVVIDRVPVDFAGAARDGGLVLAVAPRACGAGTVGVGAAWEVVRLRGERFGIEVRGGEYVGLLSLGARSLAELPTRGCIIGDYALPLLRRGGRVMTYVFQGTALFPGDDLKAYLNGNLRWLAERNDGASFVAAEASVAPGVELDQSLVGVGARVSGQGRLSRSVILPGATVAAPLAGVVVLPSGRVVTV